MANYSFADLITFQSLGNNLDNKPSDKVRSEKTAVDAVNQLRREKLKCNLKI